MTISATRPTYVTLVNAISGGRVSSWRRAEPKEAMLRGSHTPLPRRYRILPTVYGGIREEIQF